MFNPVTTHLRSAFLQGLACVLLLTATTHAMAANTLVRVTTPLGGFTLELFDDIAPVTVTNFLNYVRSGRYNGTIIHRSQPGFIIQGGWLSFNESAQNFPILQPDPPIVNEFNVSNTRGTIAMAKLPGDPNSATSQWFVNTGDNAANLDAQNGGFTAFGRVLDGGMAVVDAINAITPTELTSTLSEIPLVNYTALPLQNANIITVSMGVIENLSTHSNVFDTASNVLHVKVDAGELGLLSLAFTLYSQSPEVKIQAIAGTAKTLPATVSKIATFNTTTNELTLPEIVVGDTVAYSNVVFQLTDAAQLLFTLKSAN